MRTKAAATISLSGQLALQGQQAARGLELWASADEIELEIVDDAGRPATASDVYQSWLSAGTDLLLGPYGSNLVRRVGPITSGEGALLWNHGGSADDLSGHVTFQSKGTHWWSPNRARYLRCHTATGVRLQMCCVL